MAKQELTQTFKTEGAEETVQQVNAYQQALQDLVAEQEKLGNVQLDSGATVDQLKAQKAAVDDASRSFSELGGNVGEGAFNVANLSAAIGGVNPRIGRLARTLTEVARVAGGLGEKQLTLNGLIQAGSKLMREYSGAAKLLAAAGGAVAGVFLLVSAWEKVKLETQAAKKALEEFKREAKETVDEAGNLEEAVIKAMRAANIPLSEERVSQGLKKARSFRDVLETDDAARVGVGVDAPPSPQDLRFSRGEKRAGGVRERVGGLLTGGDMPSKREIESFERQAPEGVTPEQLQKGFELVARLFSGEQLTREEIAQARIAAGLAGILKEFETRAGHVGEKRDFQRFLNNAFTPDYSLVALIVRELKQALLSSELLFPGGRFLREAEADVSGKPESARERADATTGAENMKAAAQDLRAGAADYARAADRQVRQKIRTVPDTPVGETS